MTAVRQISSKGMLTSAGLAVILGVALTSLPGWCITYSGSAQLATGDYIFSDRTTSFALYNGLTLSTGPLRVSAGIPVLYQSTPWVSYSAVGMIPSGGGEGSQVGGRKHGGKIALPDTVTYDEIAVGDPTLLAAMEVWRQGEVLPALHLTAGLKAPLADVEGGFGTGEWDYGVGLSLTRSFGTILLFTDLTYWVLGDLDDLELLDPVSYSIALGYPLASGRYSLLFSLSGYSRIFAGVDPPMQAGFAVSHLLDSGASLSANINVGLTESAPDFAFSLGWQVGL
jgi:hypothetical protein